MITSVQKESKLQFRVNYIRLWISFFLMIGIFISVKHIQNEVQESYTHSSIAVDDPETLLNHANTYYWFARYKKNTYPEFQKSIQLAQKAKSILESNTKYQKESILLNLKADQIIEESQNWLYVSKLNMVSAIPFYAEIMRYVFSQFFLDYVRSIISI